MYAKKALDLIFLILISAIILLFGVFLIFSKPKAFSEKENRALKDAPTLTVRTFLDGKFSSELSSFCADQFPLREYLTDMKAKCELALGKQENNRVLLSSDALVDLNIPTDTKILEKNISAINEFARDNQINEKALIFCAPRSIDVNASAIGFDFSHSQNELYGELSALQINTHDLLTPLADAQKAHGNAWYATDHHWSTHGAYLAYREILDACGESAYDEDFFDIKDVSRSFLGTTYSKSGIKKFSKDTISLYRFEGDEEFELEYVAEKKTQSGFYDFEKLEKKDKYAVFLGGNFAEIKIKRVDSNQESRPRLLLIKDSFANSVIPFLSLHFDIDVIDPRYFGSSLSEKIKNTDYDKILILCGIDTLATDNFFANISK